MPTDHDHDHEHDHPCLISDIHLELADAMYLHLHSLDAYDNGTEVVNAIITTTRTLQRWYHYLDNPPSFSYFPRLTYVQPYYDHSPIGPAVPNLTINT